MEQHTYLAPTPEHEAKWGKYNDFPPNIQEITEGEFAQSMFFSYDPTMTEYRQVVRRKSGEPDPVKLCANSGLKLFYFHDNTGIAMCHDYYAKKVHYFKFFLCEHTYIELSHAQATAEGHYHGGRCYHVLKCSKCGLVTAHDSSD